MTFKLLVTAPAARSLAERLPEKVAAAVYEFITSDLLENPHRIGKRLRRPPYLDTWSARRGTYRVLSEIDDERGTVTVTAVEHRANAYRRR